KSRHAGLIDQSRNLQRVRTLDRVERKSNAIRVTSLLAGGPVAASFAFAHFKIHGFQGRLRKLHGRLVELADLPDVRGLALSGERQKNSSEQAQHILSHSDSLFLSGQDKVYGGGPVVSI